MIEIDDVLGQVVTSQPLPGQSGSVSVDVHSLPPGAYLYKITENKQLILQGKLMKN